jgi:hypothetical protein
VPQKCTAFLWDWWNSVVSKHLYKGICTKELMTSKNQPNIIITQQTSTNQSVQGGKPKGSLLVLILLIFVFFPAAIVYFFIRSW